LIGNQERFTFDRVPLANIQLGEYNGYQLEVIFCWPEYDEDDENYVCLYLKKINTSQKNESSSKDRAI
jgi:hypothetical protein